MSNTPSNPNPKPPAPPAKPGAPAARPATTPKGPPAAVDVVEAGKKNVFAQGSKPSFQPTPLKRPAAPAGDVPVVRIPVRIGGGGGRPGGSMAAPTGDRGTGGALMPGATLAGPPAAPPPASEQPVATRPAATPGKAGEGGKAPLKPLANPATKAANATIEVPKSAMKAAPDAPIITLPKDAQPSGVITEVDSMAYQGKLPVYVGSASDGNPMVDAEEARFSFDPRSSRVRLSCKVASIMIKAACLHLGLATPERGPRRYIMKCNMKPEIIEKHRDKLFDGNLEVRLTAEEDNRPVLLDLTLFQDFEIKPEV